jgi:hypothetical protein
MISWFQSLTIGGKLIIIGFWLLGILLLVAWAIFITRKLSSMPAVVPSQEAENGKKATTNPYKASTYHKPKSQFGICRLLSSCRHIVKDKSVRHATNNTRHQSKQPTQCIQPKNCSRIRTVILPFSSWHISAIVNKLRRRVNQSGKEPMYWEVSTGFCQS